MPNITIQWYAGRTDQQKREITAAITDAMVKIGKTTPDQVHILFQDVEKSNWGVNGKLASDSGATPTGRLAAPGTPGRPPLRPAPRTPAGPHGGRPRGNVDG